VDLFGVGLGSMEGIARRKAGMVKWKQGYMLRITLTAANDFYEKSPNEN